MIDEITSLFDFWLKANTSEPHRQLALLVAREILRWHYDSFEKAKASLEEYACHRHSCKDIVDRANLYRDLIRDDKHTERYITADEARKSFEKTNIGDTEKESEGGFLFFDLTKFSVGSVILPQGTQRFTQG